MDGITELKTKVEQLKKNREKVPLETLKTKYKKPYEELLHSIKELAERILAERSQKEIVVRMDEDGEKLIEEINAAIAKEAEPGGIMKRISQALYKEYDVEKFLSCVEEMRIRLWNLWIPYWQKHCCLYVRPENWEEPYPPPKIYNELTREFQNEDGTWSKHPEWETEQHTIITAGACRLLAGAIREKESKANG